MLENKKNNNIGIVILAAGEGKRMGGSLPKVMHELNGKPLVAHVVSAVEALRLPVKPVVVVSSNNTSVQEHIGIRVDYVIQDASLGTGQAVQCAEPALRGRVDDVVVLYGDMPFITAASIRRLIDEHLEKGNALTMFTCTVPDFIGWRAPFANFGRVIRRAGAIAQIVETKDATAEELAVKELSTCYYCLAADWLWEHLKQLKNDNEQGEYYLTDLVQMAIAEKKKISSIPIDPKEALGVNTKEDLEVISTL